MRALVLCWLAAACASGPSLSEADLEGWREWARLVDWSDAEACGGHPGLPDTPELLTWVKHVEGRWLTIVVDKRYDHRPLRAGMSLPVLGEGLYKGDAVVREVRDGGRILRAWHHNPVPGVEVRVGDATWTRPVHGSTLSGNPFSHVPYLRGHVTTIEGRFVDIRITHDPTRASVRLGDPFAIYVDHTYKGDAIVQEILGPGLVRGRILHPVPGTTVRIGDIAATWTP